MTGTGPTMVAPGDPRAVIWDLIAGPWRFAALRAIAVLGCADHLAAGPLTTTELAARWRPTLMGWAGCWPGRPAPGCWTSPHPAATP